MKKLDIQNSSVFVLHILQVSCDWRENRKIQIANARKITVRGPKGASFEQILRKKF